MAIEKLFRVVGREVYATKRICTVTDAIMQCLDAVM